MSFFDERAVDAAAIARLAQIHRMTTENGDESEVVRARWEEMSEEDREAFRGMVRPILEAAVIAIDFHDKAKEAAYRWDSSTWLTGDTESKMTAVLFDIGLGRLP